MFKETKNPYTFKYLITGITGPGLEKVYLPEVPPEKEIIFKKEQKFIRPEMSPDMKKWVKEMLYYREKKDAKGNLANPGYVHPHQREINAWEEREHERCDKGIWFWNNGTPTYLNGFFYWYLSSFRAYFGIPNYRETDKEITYFLQYCDEDPNSFGSAFNTIRRYGKSVLMGAWALYRATRNFNHFCGMQGETDEKIKKFYNKFIRKPFYKLPYYHQPSYNTDTKQTNQIEFDLPPRRNERRNDLDEVESLESIIEYRESGEGAYDGDPLNTYLMEEPGKTKKTSIYNEDGEGRWDIVMPCLMDGLEIIGKAFLGTTVENLNMRDKGGQAYKMLFYDSDFDNKQADGRTKSGLYAAFLPGDCALKGFWDEWGFPKREESRKRLMQRRESFKGNANKLAGHIRKYPLSIKEIFYINPTGCEFDAVVLQDRRNEIDMSTEPLWNKVDLYWKDKRFGKVGFRHNPGNGWLKVHWLPTDEKETNLVKHRLTGGEYFYSPTNDNRFACGMDPIDHGVVVDDRTGVNEEGVTGNKRSTPVVLVKLKYDSGIDGVITQDELEHRAKPGRLENGQWVLDDNGTKYPYKTNRYIAMMDTRPYDPNVLYERTLMMCWFFGVSLHVENQKPGVIRYFKTHNCGDFLLNKYQPTDDIVTRRIAGEDGTPASTSTISEYTGDISTYVSYFGHTLPFRDLIEDLLLFKPHKTREHDHTVAMGYAELACRMKPKTKEKTYMDIAKLLPLCDHLGNPLN